MPCISVPYLSAMGQCAIPLPLGPLAVVSFAASLFHPWTVQPLAATSAIVVDNQGCLGIGRRPSRCYYGYNNEYVITTTVELQPLVGIGIVRQSSCFYAHRYADGSQAEAPELRTAPSSEGKGEVIREVCLFFLLHQCNNSQGYRIIINVSSGGKSEVIREVRRILTNVL